MIYYYHYDPNKKYKFGCVIGFYNRFGLFKQTIESLNNSFLPEDLLFVIVDDGSENIDFNIGLKHDFILIRKQKNSGIASSLAIGWDLLSFLNIEFLLNIDSDVLVANNWLSVLLNTYSESEPESKNHIVTGFNAFGPENNHKTIAHFHSYKTKETLGGINLFFHRDLYNIVRDSLTYYKYTINSISDIVHNVDKYGKNPKLHNKFKGWDWGLMSLCKKFDIHLYSSYRSVIQHTGRHGSTSHPRYYEKSIDYQDITVPKIIHQLWKNNDIPDHLKIMQQSVIELHPDYEYKFWTDKDIYEFIQQHHPSLLQFYNLKFEYIIQQIDFIRLLLLYHYGGIYIDIDSFCLNRFDDILQYPCTLVVTDKHKAFNDKHYPLVLNNAFIASERYNYFIKQILLHIINYQDPQDYKEFCSFDPEYTKVLKSAGPLCVTDVYLNYQNQSMIHLISDQRYKGVEYDHTRSLSEVIPEYKKNIDKNCYALHLHESSWWKQDNKSIIPPKNPSFNPNYQFFIKSR